MSKQVPLRVALVGHGAIAATHSHAWRTVGRVFDVPQIELAVLAGRDKTRATAAAWRLGWSGATDDWRSVLTREDIDIVDVCTPSASHAEVSIAALNAGKHVLCEKPLANSLPEAVEMAATAERASRRGVRAMCGFNYRRVPAIAFLKGLLDAGRLGDVRHVRATYLQDWLTDPETPLSWHTQQEFAGSGALGDIGSHAVDLVQHLLGQSLAGVSGLTETFVRQRPLPDGVGVGQVTVDDAVLFHARLTGGAVASFEATRLATGRKNAFQFELNGSLGSVYFDLERLNELWYYDATGVPALQGFRRILVTEPEHPYLGAWWPPGHVLGWEHTFTHQARDFLVAVRDGFDPSPSFAEALQVQRVLDAVARSASANSQWTEVSETAG